MCPRLILVKRMGLVAAWTAIFLLSTIPAAGQTTPVSATSKEVASSQDAPQDEVKSLEQRGRRPSKVYLEWDHVPGASAYIVQVKDLEGLTVLDQPTSKNRHDFEILPGNYMQRVGVKNVFGKLAAWSDWQTFRIVSRSAPELTMDGPERIVLHDPLDFVGRLEAMPQASPGLSALVPGLAQIKRGQTSRGFGWIGLFVGLGTAGGALATGARRLAADREADPAYRAFHDPAFFLAIRPVFRTNPEVLSYTLYAWNRAEQDGRRYSQLSAGAVGISLVAIIVYGIQVFDAAAAPSGPVREITAFFDVKIAPVARREPSALAGISIRF